MSNPSSLFSLNKIAKIKVHSKTMVIFLPMVIALYQCVLFVLSHNSTFLLDTITLIGVLLFATAHNVKYCSPFVVGSGNVCKDHEVEVKFYITSHVQFERQLAHL